MISVSLMDPFYPIVLFISMTALRCSLLELNFRAVLDCKGRQGCAVETASLTFNLSLFFGDRKGQPCVDGSILCAYVCQGFEACSGFNHLSSSDGCELFDMPTFAITQKPGCCYYDVGFSCDFKYKIFNYLA